MLYLIAQIWLWLLVAAALGFALGWLMRWQEVGDRIDRLEEDIMLVRADRDRMVQNNSLLDSRVPRRTPPRTSEVAIFGDPESR